MAWNLGGHDINVGTQQRVCKTKYQTTKKYQRCGMVRIYERSLRHSFLFLNTFPTLKCLARDIKLMEVCLYCLETCTIKCAFLLGLVTNPQKLLSRA